MATLLARLGRTAFRRRRLFLAMWVVLLGTFGVGAVTLSEPTGDAFSIPGTESQRAIDLLDERLPAANGASARIVFAAPEGESLDATQQAAMSRALAQVGQAPGVATVSDPVADGLVSQDGRIALAQLTFTDTADDLDDTIRQDVQDAARTAEDAGLQVEFGGDAVIPAADSPLAEVIGLPVAALVLFITFGTMLAAGLPLLTALISVSTGLAGIFAATSVFDLNASAITVALMLGLAVGIDYAVFIVSRHRTELLRGTPPEDAAALAVGTAGSAVVFAGATVVIALAALSVVGIPFLTAMGLAAAGTVAVAVVVAITLVPALLGFAGPRLAKGKNHETGPRADKPSLGTRWVTIVVRRPLAATLLVVVALGALAVPVLSMRLGMPDDSVAAPGETNREAYDLLSAGFGPGFNGPLAVVVVVDRADVDGSARTVAAELGRLDDVASVGEPQVAPDGRTAIISVVSASGPSTQGTKDLVDEVRHRVGQLEETSGAEIMVTGQTAVNIDIADKLGGALLPFLGVIVGLAMLLLMVAFRSIVVPLTAIAGFLLSIGAAFGGAVAIFQEGFAAELFGVEQTGPIVSLMPVIIIGILFGLAMDYQVFLVSRMREEYVHGADPTTAVTQGFRHGARVVTAAALIMGAVFAGFILGHDMIIKSVGFTLAFGILADAFLVRMTLIPAVLELFGTRAWWLPAWLDRLLPRVDIEGQALDRHEPDAAATAVSEPVDEPVDAPAR
jgi:RND superfamily putative drug exporter